MYTVIDLSPVLFGVSFLLLCVFMFACGVIGTLVGIAIAKAVLRAIDNDVWVSQYPIEHRQSRQPSLQGETYGCTSPASGTSSGNVSKFCRVRVAGDN